MPGYPRRVEGRHAVAELYRPHGATIVLDRCYDVAVHHDQQLTGVVLLEYASQGRVVPTRAAYNNRFISVLSIVDRKVAHWRNYLDRSRSLTRSAGPPRPRATADLAGRDRVPCDQGIRRRGE